MSNRFLKTLLFTVAFVGIAGTTALGATMNFLGTWVNAASYRPGSVIAYNKGLYYSLRGTPSAPNRNHNPGNSPAWWVQVGTVGNTILSGAVNPTSPDLGQVGDFYINTSTYTIFGPKSAISPYWPATGFEISGGAGGSGPAGDTGPQGPAGDTGPQGPTGVAGLPGEQGAKGDPGAVGPAGAPGPQGPAGDTGPQGPAGVAGLPGEQGAKGDPGAVGPDGAPGPQGPAGEAGVPGAPGPKGDTGAAGPAGAPGPQGPAGVAGVPGEQGPKGDTGAVGPAGAPGLQGPAGVAGVPGSQGPRGDTGAPGSQGPAGETGPQGPKGDPASLPTIVDANGVTVGVLNGADAWIDTKEGKVALAGIGTLSYEAPGGFFYESEDCTGEAFLSARQLVRRAVIIGQDGNNLDKDGNMIFSGQLTYPQKPFELRTMHSFLEAFGTAGNQPSMKCITDVYREVVGIPSSTGVDWAAPLDIVDGTPKK